MRQPTLGFVLVCLACGFASGQSGARADMMTVKEESGFGFTQTDYAPGVNVGANNPVTFLKFLPGSAGIPLNAQLQNVQVTFDWGFQSQLSASFPHNSNPPSSISINSFGNITVGKPDTTISSPNDDPNKFLFPTQTFKDTASFASATPGDFTTTPASTYFHSLPPGYVIPPDQKVREAGPALVTNYTPTDADFAKFLGAGIVTFGVVATAGYNIPNTSGNATGTALTSAFPEMTVTYTYTAIPEPTTLALLGVGAVGLLVARRFRRRSRRRTP
jgi:hypothetical protein